MKYLKEELLHRNPMGYCEVYAAFLFYKAPPQFNRKLLYKSMERYTGSIEPSKQEKKDNLLVFEPSQDDDPLILFHLNHMISCADGQVPAQTFITPNEPLPVIPETVLEQAWDLRDAKGILSETGHCISQVLMMCGSMDYKERLQLFRSAIRATLEAVPGCSVMYWEPSMKLVDPARFLGDFEVDPIYGAYNIRLHNVSGPSDKQAMIMDTCGLSALGIPDLQCHFYDLNPNDVAGRLDDLAHYLFEQGDVIQDGHTVFEEYWKCTHEYAIIPPGRQVLDLNPGKPYYAG